MDLATYRELVDRLAEEERWLPVPGLAGLSLGLHGFVDRWRGVAERLSRSPESASQAAVILVRPGGFDRLSEDLLAAGGISRTGRVKLYPGANLYNADRLFGSAARSGALESPATQVVVLDGVDYLDQTLSQRLLRHISAWWLHAEQGAASFHIVLLLNDDGPHELHLSLRELLPAADRLQLPRLRDRREDVPFCLHYEARACGGSLNDFDPGSLQRLMDHSWPGDLGELNVLVRRLYHPPSERARRFTKDKINEVLRGPSSARSTRVVMNPMDWPLQWLEVDVLYKHCNRRANALIDGPFFAMGTTESAADPSWYSQCPELIFLQLVSWAYRKIVEEAEPNLRIVLDVHEQVFHRDDQARQTCQALNKLRTYEQHRLEYGSAHDAFTRSTVEEWFRKACGDPVPEPWQVETCIAALLCDLKNLFSCILEILRRIENDDLREILVEQWKQRRETTWPKHRFVTLVTEVLRLLGRVEGPNALAPEAVTEKLLSRLQEQLRILVDGSDKEQRLRTWVERVIADDFPETMPISTRDLQLLGLQPGPAYKQIMELLQAEYDNKKSSRESLLELSKQLVQARTIG